MATEQQRADLSIKRGRLAANIKDPGSKREFIAGQGESERKGESFEGMEAATSRESNKQAIGSFQAGGTIPKTGTYKMHKGEKVTPAPTMSPDYSRMSPSEKAYDEKLAGAERYKVGHGLVGGYMPHGPNANMVRSNSAARAPHDKDN